MYYTGSSGSSVKSSYRPSTLAASSRPGSSYLGYVPPNSAKPTPASSYQARQVPAPVARTDYITPVYNALGNIPIVTAAKAVVKSGKLSPPILHLPRISGPGSGSGSGSGYGYTTSGDVGHSGAFSAAALDYLNADLAKHYGMDQTTAYNEALSNTSYQRAVRDMQAAGLNPAVLFGNGRVSGADGVYGAHPLAASTGVSYGSYGGSSGGSSRSSRSSGSRSGKLFSKDTYGMIAGLGGLAGAGIAAATGGSIGLGALTGTTIATSAAKVLNGIFR